MASEPHLHCAMMLREFMGMDSIGKFMIVLFMGIATLN